MMGSDKGHTQGMNWSVEHAQTKTVKVELCDGRISSQRLGDSSSSSSRGASEQQRYEEHIIFFYSSSAFTICQRATGKETGENSLTACTVKLSHGNPRCSTKRQQNEA